MSYQPPTIFMILVCDSSTYFISLTYVSFLEGVLVCRKDLTAKHPEIGVSNLYVIKLMFSLKSRGYVEEKFNWWFYYWWLTNDGMEYLREYLHLPDSVVPATLKGRSRPEPPPLSAQQLPERRGEFPLRRGRGGYSMVTTPAATTGRPGGPGGGDVPQSKEIAQGPGADFRATFVGRGGSAGIRGRGGFRGGGRGGRGGRGFRGGSRGGRGGRGGGTQERGGYYRGEPRSSPSTAPPPPSGPSQQQQQPLS